MIESARKNARPFGGMSEDKRYVLYRYGAHFAWWTAFAWTAGLTVVNLVRPVDALPNTFQRVSGLFIILLMGVGIAFGSSLARMRLAATVASTFEAGLKVSTILQTNITSSACMIETDLEGDISAVEHADVIGWKSEDLVDKSFDILIPDRHLRQHQAAFKEFKNGNSDRITGTTVNIPITTRMGEEVGMRLSMARLGDTLLGTLTPSGSKEYRVDE